MTQRFELGDAVVFNPYGGPLRRGRVLAISGAESLAWLTVDTGDAQGEVQVSSHAALLVGSSRRRFLDDVITAVTREITSSHVGVALDRFWLDAWEADPDGVKAEALTQAEAMVRTRAEEDAAEVLRDVVAELEALFADLPEPRQTAVWNVSREYWLGHSRSALHGAERLREALLAERWPERHGTEAYEALIDQSRDLRRRATK